MDWNYTNILYYVIGAVFLLLVIAAFVVLRKKRLPQRPYNPYVEALKLLIDGEQKEAFARLQESIRSGLAPTDAYIRLGTMLRDAGDPFKALQIHKSLTVKTDLSRKEKLAVYLNMAKDYSALGKSEQAVSVLETAMKKMHLKEPAVFSVLAKEYHLLGSIEAAYNQLKETAKLGVIGDRELSLYLSSAGEQMFDDGNEKEARKLLNRALKHHPENATAMLILGNLEEKSGNEEAAVEQWKKTANVSAELSESALRNIERVMFQRGRFSEVEHVYAEVLDARPWDEYATLSLAAFYKKQGRGREAIDFLEEFRSVHSESVGTTLLLTSLYATQKDAEALEKFLDENEANHSRAGVYECGECGFKSVTMRWHCPRCNTFDSFSKSDEI